ncbi:pitrilysin family protein [Nocardioides hungaricus]
MTTTLTRLDNGLTVTVERRATAPAAALNIWYDVGSRHERTGQTGLAHLFEHLMFQGSANVRSGEHFGLLQDVGADLNATTDFDRTNYFEVVPTGALDLALWLEADRLATLPEALNQENLDNQRDVVKNEKRQSYDDVPYGSVWKLLYGAMFPQGHPYDHLPIGSMADLDAATVEDCAAFFHAYYRPANGFLSIVGDVDPDEAVQRVQHYFGGLVDGAGGDGSGRASEADQLPPLAAPVRTLVDDEPVPTEHVYRAWRAPADRTPEADAVELALMILADGPGARVHDRLVRREELARPGGWSELSRLYTGNSVALMSIPLPTGGDLGRAEAALDEEVARFLADGPTEREVRGAKERLVHRYLRHSSDLGGRADELSRFACLYGDATLADGVVDGIRAVETDEIVRQAGRWLDPASSATIAYQPKEESQ